MERDDKKALKIILGVFGCLGCAGVVFFLAVFGVGFWVSSVTPPMLPPITPPIHPSWTERSSGAELRASTDARGLDRV